MFTNVIGTVEDRSAHFPIVGFRSALSENSVDSSNEPEHLAP